MSTSNQPPSFNEDSLDSKISRLLTLQELDAEDRAEFRKEVRDRLEVLSARIHSQGERLDRTSQSTDLLTKDSEESATKLDSINKKLDYTNGAIAEAKKSIYGLEQKAKNQLAINIEIDEIIQFKNFVQKYMLNRYALGALMVLTFGFIKISSNSELRELLLKVVGIS